MTPHDLVVYKDGEVVLRVPKSGHVARVSVHEEPAEPVGGVPTVRRTFGEPDPRPEELKPGVYLVSSLYLEAARDRAPAGVLLLAPDTGPTAVRDAEDRIIGVTRFVR